MDRKLTEKERAFLLDLRGIMEKHGALLSVENNRVCIDVNFSKNEEMESLVLPKPISTFYDLDDMIDKDIPHTVIGRVCTEECNTTCLHYCRGTCPCKAVKDVNGNFIHVFVDPNQE